MSALNPKVQRRGIRPAHLTALRSIAIVVAFVLLMVCSILLLNDGSKTGLALGGIVVAAPVAVYVACRRPILFPFALYVALMPFDNLIQIAKFGTLSKLTGILSALAIAFWLIRKRHIVNPGAPVIYWGAVAAWAAATLAWSISPDDSRPLLTTFIQLFTLYAVVALVPVAAKDFRAVMAAVVIGSTTAAVYAWHLFRNGIDVTSGSRLYIKSDAHTTLDPNQFALALVLPIAIVMMNFLSARRVFKKGLWLSLLVPFGAGIVASGSRGSMVAIGVLCLFFLWKSRYQRQLAPFMLICGIGSLALIPSILARWALATSTGGAGRFSIWHVAFEAWKRYWLAGAGIGGFPTAYDRFYLTIFQEYNADWHRGSHSLIVGASVELGVIGLGLMLVAWFQQYKSLSTVPRSSPYYDLAVCLQGALVALFTGSLFLDIMYQKYTWLVFILIALARNLIFHSRSDDFIDINLSGRLQETAPPARAPAVTVIHP